MAKSSVAISNMSNVLQYTYQEDLDLDVYFLKERRLQTS